MNTDHSALIERLNANAKGAEFRAAAADFDLATWLNTLAADLREAATALAALVEESAEVQRMLDGRIEMTREKNARIVELERQMELGDLAWKVRIKSVRAERDALAKVLRALHRILPYHGGGTIEPEACPVPECAIRAALDAVNEKP